MKNHFTFTKLLSILLLLSVFLLLLIGCKKDAPITTDPPKASATPSVMESSVAAETADPSSEGSIEIETTGGATGIYTFADTVREKAGYAEGSITITPTENGKKTGYYLLYFSKNGEVLEEYESIAAVKITGKTVKTELPYGMFLPSDATEILVFESTRNALTSFKGQTPAAVIDIPDDKILSAGAYSYSFASVSDVHMNYTDYGAAEKWTNALNFFAEKELDAVVVSGDMTGSGTVQEYDAYFAAIKASNFPAKKIFEARGNHDSPNNGLFLRFTSGEGDIRPFTAAPYFYRLEKGAEGQKDNLFIFMAQELTDTGNTHLQDNFSDKQMEWLEGLLKEYAGTNTNIFIVQHSMIRNFGPGDRYDGVYVQPLLFTNQYKNNLRLKALLTEYKEVIMMTGHTHLSFYDLLNYSDENGTAARMIHNSSISQPRSYTASGSISYDSEGKTTKTTGSEGYLVYVYNDYILYIGYNLTTEKIIPRASFILESYTEKRGDPLSIELKSSPEKTTYRVGELFDLSGLLVEAVYADGHKAVVTGWGIDKVGELSSEDKEITVFYGELSTTIPIHVKEESAFEGEGSKDSPYLIANAEDFLKLTDLFNQSTDEATAFGTGKFFLQTADIDMTDVEGYSGTAAQGGKKFFFGGNYNGNGYTLTVNITASSGQCSIFPYITGAVYNLAICGSISAPESAQPFRTIQKSGVIANCAIALTLTSDIENGLCYSNHGTIFRNYVHCNAKNALCITNDGATYNVITTSSEFKNFLNENASDSDAGLAALKKVISDFAQTDLLPFKEQDGELVFEKRLNL